jgi:hypothetical protein
MRQLDLDRPRSVAEILAATARLYRTFPLLFPTLALAVEGPYLLAVLAITGHGPFSGHEGFEMNVLTMIVSYGFVTPLISALHIHAVTAVGEGRRPRIMRVAVRGVQVLPAVAAAELVSTIGTFLGFLALIIPGIVLLLRWAVVAQAAAVEDEGWLPALRSSARLTDSHYSHVFALLVSVGIPLAGVGLSAKALAPGSASAAPSVAVGIVVRTVLASVSALTTALLYFDLRARPEVQRRAGREHPQLRDLDP